MLTIILRGSAKWGSAWWVMEGKERVSVLFCLFMQWEMIKSVCMVMGAIQSSEQH